MPVLNPLIYTILRYDSTVMMAMYWHYNDAHPDSLTWAQVDSLESIVDSAYRAFTKDSTVYQHDLLPLKTYVRQYVAVINSSGQREVWINFICGDYGDWRDRAVIVDDGGNCYFQLFIDVLHRRAYELIPGGSASTPNKKPPLSAEASIF